MKYRHEERAAELIGKLFKEEEGIMRAEKAVTGISRDYLKYAREMAIAKNRMDRAQERYEGRKEGREEGREEGRIEGETHKALVIARNMINLGLPFETVVSATQLDPDKVKALYQKRKKNSLMKIHGNGLSGYCDIIITKSFYNCFFRVVSGSFLKGMIFAIGFPRLVIINSSPCSTFLRICEK